MHVTCFGSIPFIWPWQSPLATYGCCGFGGKPRKGRSVAGDWFREGQADPYEAQGHLLGVSEVLSSPELLSPKLAGSRPDCCRQRIWPRRKESWVKERSATNPTPGLCIHRAEAEAKLRLSWVVRVTWWMTAMAGVIRIKMWLLEMSTVYPECYFRVRQTWVSPLVSRCICCESQITTGLVLVSFTIFSLENWDFSSHILDWE